MAVKDYIDRKEFIEAQRRLYCENCERRKGTKRWKPCFVHKIGGAPCRACDIGDMLDDVEDFPAADVRPVVRGRWIMDDITGLISCSECQNDAPIDTTGGGQWYSPFCPSCGARM